MSELILASGSQWRRQLLQSVGIQCRAEASGVEEDHGASADPTALATLLSEQKAEAVAARYPEAWVLGADQVAYDPEAPEGHFGKPRNPVDHLARLKAMRGRPHVLVTGWTLLGPGLRRQGSVRTTLHVRADLEDAELQAYVASGEGSGCAAGYMAEGRGAFLFERIDGDWFNVLGLPLHDIWSVLRAEGWRFGPRESG